MKSQKPKAPASKVAREILVADLKIGDLIVTKLRPAGWIPETPEGLTKDEEVFWRYEAQFLRYAEKTEKVREIEECLGKWRTHVHVNKKDCYDERCSIWVTQG